MSAFCALLLSELAVELGVFARLADGVQIENIYDKDQRELALTSACCQGVVLNVLCADSTASAPAFAKMTVPEFLQSEVVMTMRSGT